MMHDAEIATVLINRWTDANDDLDRPVDLLHEGGIRFNIARVPFQSGNGSQESDIDIEYLTFDDGSRALRLVDGSGLCMSSPWIAIAPMRVAVKE
jgi:hypothetical protein